MNSMTKLNHTDIQAGLQEARRQRAAEREAVEKQYPIPEDATPEEEHSILMQREAAMLDP